MLMTGEPITAQEAHRLGMVNEVHPRAELMGAMLSIAEKIANNSPTAVQSVKRAVQKGQGEPVEQAVAIMMDEHWRSVVHTDRVEGIMPSLKVESPYIRILTSNRSYSDTERFVCLNSVRFPVLTKPCA